MLAPLASAFKSKCLVLLVEDSDDDALLFELAFQKVQWLSLTARVTGGEQAIAYLSGEGQYADRSQYPFPRLLMLDLHMPRVDGFEVLEWLKTHQFHEPLTIVVSGSDYPADIRRAMELGAHLYRTKQLSLIEQIAMFNALEAHLCGSLGLSTPTGGPLASAPSGDSLTTNIPQT